MPMLDPEHIGMGLLDLKGPSIFLTRSLLITHINFIDGFVNFSCINGMMFFYLLPFFSAIGQ